MVSMYIREWSDEEDNLLLDEISIGYSRREISQSHRRLECDVMMRQYYLLNLFLRDTNLSLDEIERLVGLESDINNVGIHQVIILYEILTLLNNNICKPNILSVANENLETVDMIDFDVSSDTSSYMSCIQDE